MSAQHDAAASPVEHPKHAPLPDEHEVLATMLEHLVGQTEASAAQILRLNVDHSALTPGILAKKQHGSWWKRFFPDGFQERLDELFVDHGMGNRVAIRGTDQQFIEAMPIYVRVGMHLLFYKSKEASFLRYESVDDLLKTLTVRQGKIYDDASDPQAVLAHIASFVQTYSIDLTELLEEDLARYPTFNSFFFRRLKPGARPQAEPTNTALVTSCADCRLTVFDNVSDAQHFWIKGKQFSLRHLLSDTNLADRCFPPGSALAIARLAPQDFHRFCNPVGPVVCGPTRHANGEYYTVNPQAVNADFDVFTCNRRDVLLLDWTPKPGGPQHSVAFVAIGAMLVGSIGWTNSNQGSRIERGDEVGYFAYGGSTVVCVFPPSAKVQWDQDLLDNSHAGVETLVRIGDRIGVSTA